MTVLTLSPTLPRLRTFPVRWLAAAATRWLDRFAEGGGPDPRALLDERILADLGWPALDAAPPQRPDMTRAGRLPKVLDKNREERRCAGSCRTGPC
jgi:hypothetical protein